MVYTQQSTKQQWHVKHDLNYNDLNIQCWADIGGILTRIIPCSVEYVDSNNIQITFLKQRLGRVQITRSKRWQSR